MKPSASLYDKLCRQHPGREIRLVLDKYKETYEEFGYQPLVHCVEKSECDEKYDYGYWFMLGPEETTHEIV